MSHPRAWRRYVQALKSEEAPTGQFARFAARYNLAASLQGVVLEGAADETADAYASALGVGWAYSAIESLDHATGSRGARGAITDPALAKRYRSASLSSLRAMLESTADSSRLREQLFTLAEDADAQNILPAAKALRHAVFHGDFTAYGAGAARSKGVRTFLHDLKASLLASADTEFELYLDRHVLGPWDVQVLRKCPSCKTPIGRAHGSGCSIGRCRAHGEPRDQCFGEGRHSSTTYWGVYPGTVEALKRGWTLTSQGSVRPDLNRVMVDLTWDPATEQFI